MRANPPSEAQTDKQLMARWKPIFDAFQGFPSSIDLSEEGSDLPAEFRKLFAEQSVTLEVFAREMQCQYDHDILFRLAIEDLEADHDDGQTKSEKMVVRETVACKACWRYAHLGR